MAEFRQGVPVQHELEFELKLQIHTAMLVRRLLGQPRDEAVQCASCVQPAVSACCMNHMPSAHTHRSHFLMPHPQVTFPHATPTVHISSCPSV